MKKMRILGIGLMMVCCLVLVDGTPAEAKTVRKTMKMESGEVTHKYPAIFAKATRVKVKNSNPKVVKAKYINNKIKGKCLYFKAKEGGTSKVTVSVYRKKKLLRKFIYKVTRITADAKKTFAYQNEERVKLGVPELQWDDNLYEIAQVRAKEIVKSFEHDMDTPKMYLGTHFALGENIYEGYRINKDVIASWVNSSGHYRNMTNTDYKIGAIAYAKSKDGDWYWVALFSKYTSEEILEMNVEKGTIPFSSRS